jgi:hypothetical protein
MYLDKNGAPCARGCDASHLLPKEETIKDIHKLDRPFAFNLGAPIDFIPRMCQ